MAQEIKTIPVRQTSDIDYFLFSNFDIADKKCIRILPVIDKYYKQNYQYFSSRCNKDYLEQRFGFLMRNIGLDKVKVEIYNDPETDIKTTERIIKDLRDHPSSSYLKDIFARFAALINSDQRNIIAFLNYCSSDSSDALVKELATRGVVTFDEACDIMGIQKPEGSYYSYWDRERYSKPWYNRIDSKSILFYSQIIYAARQQTKEYYYDEKELCMCCTQDILKYYYLKQYRGKISLELYSDTDISEMGLKIFDNTDIASQAVTIDTMRQSGLIKIGKTKISLNDFKKVRNNIGNLVLPKLFSHDNNDGIEILTSLILYARENQSEHHDTPQLLRSLYDSISTKWTPELMNVWLSDSTSKLPLAAQFNLSISSHMSALTLFYTYLGFSHTDEQWISLPQLYNLIGLESCTANADMLFPTDEYYGRDKFKDTSGMTLPFKDYKERIHDVIIDGALLTFATLGGIEFAVDNDNMVMFVRLTDLGKWYLDKNRKFPQSLNTGSTENDFEYDDTTLLVRVVNDKSMYLPIAKDLLTQVSSTRFAIEPKSTTKGCNDKEDLETRLGKIREYFVNGDCPNFDAYCLKLQGRCDLVKPSRGGTTWQLHDIDPSNQELLELISNDPQIKKHTLRVEGYKLLIKKDFYPTFVGRLRAAGFILKN